MIRILPSLSVALVACAPAPQEAAMPDPDQSRAAENPAPAQMDGRRILSAAFVRVGADGHLTLKLRDGRVLVLRDVVMRRKDYCGVQMLHGQAGALHCGGYAEVAAAQPGGAPALKEPDLAGSNPLQSSGSPAKSD